MRDEIFDLAVAAVRQALEDDPLAGENTQELAARLIADNRIIKAALNNLAAKHFALAERVNKLLAPWPGDRIE